MLLRFYCYSVMCSTFLIVTSHFHYRQFNKISYVTAKLREIVPTKIDERMLSVRTPV